MADPHALGLSKGRFWSSGVELPVTRIIARVLADPTEPDLHKLKQHFGMDMIMETWEVLIKRREIADSVVPITETMLKNLTEIHEVKEPIEPNHW